MDLLALSVAVVALVLSIVAALLAAGVTVRLSNLERRQAPAPREGLVVGSEIPATFAAAITPGRDIDAWMRGPTLLVFAAADCQPCRELLTAVRPRDLEAFGGRVAIIERPGADGPWLADSITLDATYIRDDDGVLAAGFETNVTPHSFAVRDGRVAAQTIGSDLAQLTALVGNGAPDS